MADSTAKNKSISEQTEQCLRYVQINGFDVDQQENILTAGKRYSSAACTDAQSDSQNIVISYVSLINNYGKLSLLNI